MATYPTYVSLATLQEYLGASPRATAFLALDPDVQDQWLVEATRMLMRQSWDGDPAWASDVDDPDVPQAILDGCCELALALYLDATPLSASVAGNNVKSVTAKGVGVEFFAASADTAGRFPVIVQELVGRYLAGEGSDTCLPSASGTCERSQFTACHDFDLTDGG